MYERDILYFPLLPIIAFVRCVPQTRCELLHHSCVVTCIIASDMPNLHNDGKGEHNGRHKDITTHLVLNTSTLDNLE